jgi:hypothetical protein
MHPVEEFIYNYDGNRREIMLFLHDLLVSDFNLRSGISYKIPFYYRKSWICYMNPTKDGGIEFAFQRGNELSNEQGLLVDRGRKQVRGIIFKTLFDIPLPSLREVLQEAILLDEKIQYKSFRLTNKKQAL